MSATGLTVASANGGTINSFSIVGNQVTVNYTAPNAVGDRIKIS